MSDAVGRAPPDDHSPMTKNVRKLLDYLPLAVCRACRLLLRAADYALTAVPAKLLLLGMSADRRLKSTADFCSLRSKTLRFCLYLPNPLRFRLRFVRPFCLWQDGRRRRAKREWAWEPDDVWYVELADARLARVDT